MASSVSKLSFLLRKRRFDDAMAMVAPYQTVVSGNVSITETTAKVLGTILHVAKAKRLGYAKTVGEKIET